MSIRLIIIVDSLEALSKISLIDFSFSPFALPIIKVYVLTPDPRVFTIEIKMHDFTVDHIVFKNCEPVADSEVVLHDFHLDDVFPNDLHNIDG
jgi:hypothetical protein